MAPTTRSTCLTKTPRSCARPSRGTSRRLARSAVPAAHRVVAARVPPVAAWTANRRVPSATGPARTVTRLATAAAFRPASWRPTKPPTSSASLGLARSRPPRCDVCMTPGELAAVRGRLEGFAAEMFAPLVRRDQRDKGATYVRGLLLDGRRKSMQPMAERLGVDHQGLQHFVSSSTWAVEPVRERLARRAVEVIAPEAWVVDDTGFVKDGTASPGVARQYSGTLGKVGNCQIGVSISAVTDAASCPLDWRLFLPERWDDSCATEE